MSKTVTVGTRNPAKVIVVTKARIAKKDRALASIATALRAAQEVVKSAEAWSERGRTEVGTEQLDFLRLALRAVPGLRD